MILYLYALADGIERVEDATGVCGETPIVIPLPACALVAGWIDEAPAIDRDALTRQDALVRRVHEIARAVLPMRFGTTAAGIDAATRSIEGLGTAVRERLELVTGREQMTVRITGAPGALRSVGCAPRCGAPVRQVTGRDIWSGARGANCRRAFARSCTPSNRSRGPLESTGVCARRSRRYTSSSIAARPIGIAS